MIEADWAAVANVLGAIDSGEELPQEGELELMTALSGPAYPAPRPWCRPSSPIAVPCAGLEAAEAAGFTAAVKAGLAAATAKAAEMREAARQG